VYLHWHCETETSVYRRLADQGDQETLEHLLRLVFILLAHALSYERLAPSLYSSLSFIPLSFIPLSLPSLYSSLSLVSFIPSLVLLLILPFF
jgi:hypothetical protein